MNQYQCQVPLGGLPINLMLVGNREEGRVVFVRVAPYNGDIFDSAAEPYGVCAGIGPEGLMFMQSQVDGTVLVSEHYQYNTIYDYKSMPLMLRWLQQQKLEQPA